MFSIGNKQIGPGEPCFIIAEAGVNHNGDIELAKKLIDVAAESGADAVKFQTFKAENLTTAQAKKAAYQVSNTGTNESQREMLKKLELTEQVHHVLKAHAEKAGIIFLSTPFDFESARFLKNLGVPAFKVGSGDLTNIPFLKMVAEQGLPLIISTGMANMDEVRESVKAVEETGLKALAVLHCTSNYPCPPEEVNLRAMRSMAELFDYPVGYSDHTIGITAGIAAVAMGAQILEKHFTLDKTMEGPDHRASLEPGELKEFVDQVRITGQMLGDGVKKPNPSEEVIMEQVRKSIVAAHDIPAGKTAELGDFAFKRPASGLKPSRAYELLGRKFSRDISADEEIKLSDFQ